MVARTALSNPYICSFDVMGMDEQYGGIEMEEFKEPESWTIITALNRVLEMARSSKLGDKLWNTCKNPLAYLREQLQMTNNQIVFLAIMIESGESLSWRRFSKYLGCSRLSALALSEEIECLVAKRWCTRREERELGENSEVFVLASGVVKALRKNKTFVPERIDGFDVQQFIETLESHMEKNQRGPRMIEFTDEEEWMFQLAEANPHLPLCHEVLGLEDIHDRSLLLMAVFNYAQCAGSESEGLKMSFINELYPEEYACGFIRRNLRNGSHTLIRMGLLEHRCDDGMANPERYMLTKKAKEELLAGYTPSCSRVHSAPGNSRLLKSPASISEKELFYNAAEQEQIERLAKLLSRENLPSVQGRLEENGLRKGFACLFYGAPGTGKTETALQIARKTGRGIMVVDIAGMRDKYVGESEKNIKAVFTQYRDLCKKSEVMPILLFNEADALINRRNENIEHAVDRMDNAMQDVILQEIENLEGILIATTNLTSNLDSAFERRFLFKIEFKKPETSVKAEIWKSMLKDLSDDDAQRLAGMFDFSGGQIENIVRKRTIDYILNGRVASLDDMIGYCMAEAIGNRQGTKRVCGFASM